MRPTREVRPRPIVSHGLGVTIGGFTPGASDVQVEPTVAGFDNVQDVLENHEDRIADLEAGIETPVVDHGNMGATETIDVTAGVWHRGTLNTDCTITVSGFTVDEGLVVVFEVAQDGTGGWGITWDADVEFFGDDQPDLTATATTIFMLWSSAGDTTIYAGKIGGSGSALTVEDEGTPLATAATGLDFVGAGVTASGTGATKTITIPGVTEEAVQAVGHYELLMTGSSPPEPLEDGTGTDWLYVWVNP